MKRFQITDRGGFQIYDLNAEQGTDEDVAIPSVLDEKFYFCYNFFVFLDFIEKQKGFSRNNFFVTVQRKLENQVINIRRVFQNRNNVGFADKIEFHIAAALRFQAVADDIGFSRLSDSV